MFVASHPEEIHQFRVVWGDDRGQLQMHRGFCVNYSTALGSLQGPVRFEATVTLDIIRFLGWEQLLKNAYLHHSSAGAFAAGADFDPRGKSSNEIISFCDAFMAQISKNSPITADSIIAEIGVSKQTLEWCQSSLQGIQHPRISREPAITHAEASAISLVCYAETMLHFAENSQDGLRNQIVTISGSGKLAIATAIRALEVGAKIVSLSDRNGSIVHPAGFTIDQVIAVQAGKSNRASLASIMRPMVASGEVTYYPRERPWQHVQGATIALPCAVEDEVELADAETLIRKGVEYVLEGSTMSCTQAAVDAFERCPLQGLPKVWYAPSKITTAASLGVRSEEHCFRVNPYPWHKNQWIQRLTEATQTNARDTVSVLHEYMEGVDIRTPDFNLGSCLLAVTRLARTMQQHGVYWC